MVRLEARPANLEGRGEVTIRRLVRNALRMRPDRIIVGEVRGPEALDMLGAMSTGHDGSLATVHAGSPEEALRRVETLAPDGRRGLPHAAVREQVAAAIDLVVHQARLAGGARQITRWCRCPGWPAARPPARSMRSWTVRRASPPARRPPGRGAAMTGAAVVAGVAGACAVGATWELLATVERTRASERMTRLLAPLRRPQHAATATEQRAWPAPPSASCWPRAGCWPGCSPGAAGVAAPWLVRRLLRMRRGRWRARAAQGVGRGRPCAR